MQQSEPIAVKAVIVGDGSVGKTCILVTYTTDKFPQVYIPTVFDNYSAQIRVDNKMINLGLWDTAGQEEYNQLRQISYPQSDVFLIAFNVMENSTFDNAIKKWYAELTDKMPSVPKLFIGNKSDLRTASNPGISVETITNVVNQLGCRYVECSALTQVGLKQVFDDAIRTALNKRQAPLQIQDGAAKSARRKQQESDKSANICFLM